MTIERKYPQVETYGTSIRSYSYRIFRRIHIVYRSYTDRISIKNTAVTHRPGLQRNTAQIQPY